MAVETEIKLRVGADRLHELLAAITSLGFASGERVLEIDQLYDNGNLRAQRQLLRLRQRGARTTLTYKGPPVEGRHKSREEIETDIGDHDAFVRILAALGFHPSFRYEKKRTTFAAAGEAGIVTLDETPIGVFLELEGEAEWIDRTAARLGFGEQDYITASYASLYQQYRSAHEHAPLDMRF